MLWFFLQLTKRHKGKDRDTLSNLFTCLFHLNFKRIFKLLLILPSSSDVIRALFCGNLFVIFPNIKTFFTRTATESSIFLVSVAWRQNGVMILAGELVTAPSFDDTDM